MTPADEHHSIKRAHARTCVLRCGAGHGRSFHHATRASNSPLSIRACVDVFALTGSVVFIALVYLFIITDRQNKSRRRRLIAGSEQQIRVIDNEEEAWARPM